MKERPIILSGEEVRAVLSGAKTQTRRVLTVPWTRRTRVAPYPPYYEDADGVLMEMDEAGHYHPAVEVMTSPFGRPGDRLWVKEACAVGAGSFVSPHYFADGPLPSLSERHDIGLLKKVSPIHMPRRASRLTLQVVSVRVERLCDITYEDAEAEGHGVYDDCGFLLGEGTIEAFAEAWDARNAKRGHGWDANPWVWCVTFRKVEGDS